MLRTPSSLSSYPSSTWAGLPAAAAAQGQVFRVTDFGVAGVGLMVISDGTRWLPLGPQILGRSGVGVSVTGTTSETTLATVTVPAGALGLNGAISVQSAWSASGTNSKSLRVRFGGIAGTAYLWLAPTASLSASDERRIRNRGSASSQIGSAAQGAAGLNVGSGSGLMTSAVDTTAAVDLVFTGQLTVAGESVTLENREVWWLP